MTRESLRRLSFAAVAATLPIVMSCTHAAKTPAPSTTPQTASAPTGAAPARRLPPPRDSMEKLRAVYVAAVMKDIAGRENEPAEVVFKNIQVLKGMTAGALVKKMNDDYANALSWNCTNCHRLAAQGNFASDTATDKKRARFMQQMTDLINKEQLPKLYPKNTPKVECVTCHRGYNEPPEKTLIPERGKPGGPPLPTRPPGL